MSKRRRKTKIEIKYCLKKQLRNTYKVYKVTKKFSNIKGVMTLVKVSKKCLYKNLPKLEAENKLFLLERGIK